MMMPDHAERRSQHKHEQRDWDDETPNSFLVRHCREVEIGV